MKGHIRHLHPGECPPRCRNPAAWQAIVYAGRDPVTGRKRQKTATRRGKREAEGVLAELVARYGHGRRVAPADATVEDLLWRWLEHAKTDGDGMSPPSASAAASHIRLYLAPRVGRHKVARLDAEDLVRCYDDLRHFVASAMLRGGIDLVRAAARTGHAETTLLRHYAHFIGGGREAALLLAGLVDGPGPGATAEAAAEDG
jgi:integrase